MACRTCVFVLVGAVLLPVSSLRLQAQDKERKSAEKDKEKDKPGETPKEESSVTDHTLKIGNQAIPYKATASTILLKNNKDEPTALIYSTAYIRTDTKDLTQRPISFVYNGGPGAASLWLPIGAFGPRPGVAADAVAPPPPPRQPAPPLP